MPTQKQYLDQVQGDWTAAEISVSYKPGVKFNTPINNPGAAYVLIEFLWDQNLIHLQEQFLAIYLNGQTQVIGYRFLNTGNMRTAIIDVRLLVSLALHCMAASVIIAHNHPSGVLKPSPKDIALTEQIKKALETIQVTLNDHLIIIAGGWLSMGNEGLL